MPSNQQLSREHIERQRRIEAEWRNRIFWALRRSKRPFFDMIKQSGLPMANAIGPAIIDPVPIRRVLERLYRDVASNEAARQYNEGIKVKEFSFGAAPSWLADINAWFSTFITNLTSDITTTTWKYITDIINKGLTNGDGYDKIIEALRATGQDKRRAALIARTESNKSMGWAAYQAAGKLPYPVVLVWIAANDRRTRGSNPNDKADHRHLDGKRVDYGTPFQDPISKALMLYTGDTTNGAGPGDVCNCRCTIATRKKVVR